MATYTATVSAAQNTVQVRDRLIAVAPVRIAYGPWGGPVDNPATSNNTGAVVTTVGPGVLVAAIAVDGPAGTGPKQVSSVTDDGGSVIDPWEMIGGGYSPVNDTSCVEFWAAKVTGNLTNVTVTANVNSGGNFALCVYFLRNIDIDNSFGMELDVANMGNTDHFYWAFTGTQKGSQLLGCAFPESYAGTSGYDSGTTAIQAAQNGVVVNVKKTTPSTGGDFTLGYTMSAANTSAAGTIYGVEARPLVLGLDGQTIYDEELLESATPDEAVARSGVALPRTVTASQMTLASPTDAQANNIYAHHEPAELIFGVAEGDETLSIAANSVVSTAFDMTGGVIERVSFAVITGVVGATVRVAVYNSARDTLLGYSADWTGDIADNSEITLDLTQPLGLNAGTYVLSLHTNAALEIGAEG